MGGDFPLYSFKLSKPKIPLHLFVEFANSDVLWISDFRIPKTTESLLRQMESYRNEGTRFYGLQIGMTEHCWEKYFDHIYKVSFDVSRSF